MAEETRQKEEQTTSKKRRTGRRVARRTSVGVKGPTALDLLYRLGSLTAPHLAILGGMSKSQAQATLQSLRENGICEQRNQKPSWFEGPGRAPAHYYLSRRSGGAGVLEGAAAAGIEARGKRSQKALLNHYSTFALPSHVQHVWLRNEFFVRLAAAVQKSDPKTAWVPTDRMHGEGFSRFPLKGGYSGRSVTVHPDGQFEVGLSDEEGNDFYQGAIYVEAEAWARRAEAKAKIGRYMDLWCERMHHERGAGRGMIKAGFAPVVFLYPRHSQAVSIRNYVRSRMEAELKDNREPLLNETPLQTLLRKFEHAGFPHHPGEFFGFVGVDRIVQAKSDGTGAVFGAAYSLLWPYDAEGARDGASDLWDILDVLHELDFHGL